MSSCQDKQEMPKHAIQTWERLHMNVRVTFETSRVILHGKYKDDLIMLPPSYSS